MKYLILISFFILGCTSNNDLMKKKVIEKLTNGNIKYWDLKIVEESNGKKIVLSKLIRSVRFSASGEYFPLLFRNGKRIKYKSSDVIYPNKWIYINPKTIILDFDTVYIELLTNDTLIYRTKEGEKFFYVNFR